MILLKHLLVHFLCWLVSKKVEMRIVVVLMYARNKIMYSRWESFYMTMYWFIIDTRNIKSFSHDSLWDSYMIPSRVLTTTKKWWYLHGDTVCHVNLSCYGSTASRWIWERWMWRMGGQRLKTGHDFKTLKFIFLEELWLILLSWKFPTTFKFQMKHSYTFYK